VRAEPSWAIVATLLFALQAPAGAQTAPPAAASLDGVVREIRLLRETLERQNALNARAQLLLGRLALQDQRTARARQAVERLEGDLVTAERERDQLQASMRETTRNLDQASEPDRLAMESQLRMMRDQFAHAQAQIASVENRLNDARQTLAVETGRYDDLDNSLTALDRLIQPAP